jgi:hypothetical protein
MIYLKYYINILFIGMWWYIMCHKNRILALFLIFVMVNFTPAFAIKMEQVANEAEDYNNESQKEMGFFKKIGFMVKGFELIDKAKDANNNPQSTENSTNEDIHRQLFKQTVMSEIQKKKLLDYRNNNTLNNSKISNVNGINNTINQTKGNEQVVNTIPEECFFDITCMINALRTKGINATQNLQQTIDTSLQGNIIQLIDEKGNIRYAYIKSIDLKSGKIILLNDQNKELTISLKEFKKSFKGLTLKITSNITPGIVMGEITTIKKDDLKKEKTQAQNAEREAKNKIILWSILLGVSILLIIVGAIIATYFGKALVKQCINPSATQRYNIDFLSPTSYERMVSKMRLLPNPPSQDTLINIAYTTLTIDWANPLVVDNLIMTGFSVITLSSLEIVGHVISQNWVKFILATVGLIILIVGLGLAIASAILLYRSVIHRELAKYSLEKIDENNKNLDKWLNKSQTINNIIPENNTTKQHLTPSTT